jgi:hypothetical protein
MKPILGRGKDSSAITKPQIKASIRLSIRGDKFSQGRGFGPRSLGEGLPTLGGTEKNLPWIKDLFRPPRQVNLLEDDIIAGADVPPLRSF